MNLKFIIIYKIPNYNNLNCSKFSNIALFKLINHKLISFNIIQIKIIIKKFYKCINKIHYQNNLNNYNHNNIIHYKMINL